MEPPDGEYRDFPSYEHIDVTIHYFRYDQQYQGWNLWVWPDGKDGHEIAFTGEDEFGKIAKLTVSDEEGIKNSVSFYVRARVEMLGQIENLMIVLSRSLKKMVQRKFGLHKGLNGCIMIHHK